MRIQLWAAAAVAVVVASSAGAAPLIYTGSASSQPGLAPVVDAYRDVLGDLNAPAPVNAVGGRRQIDWDAAPDAVSDPNDFPGDFFNFSAAPRARGIEFQATGTTSGFQLSSTQASGEPTRFGRGFGIFSEERLFAPLGGTTFDVKFFDPVDQVTPALTRGLGVVFTDVEVANATTMSFFDINDNLLETVAVPVSDDGGLSFVGVAFDDPRVFRVAIMAGLSPIDGPAGEIMDVVAMDDFIFGEMTPVPLPASVALLGAGIAGLGAMRRMRRQS